MTHSKKLSLIVPVYNEALGIETFHKSLLNVIDETDYDYEILYIDDGSLDDSAKILERFSKDNSKVKPLYFSRNFGKELATTAGIHNAKGDALIILDADGQHPVTLIPDFIQHWEDGAEVVIGVRTTNQKEGPLKHFGSKMFYSILKILGVNNVKPGSTDFRLIDKRVQREFNKLTEHNRVTRALIDWLGFNCVNIEFKANAREHGSPSYSFKKLLQLAFNGFISLSFAPLYMSGYLGVFITLSSFLAGIGVFIESYLLNDPWNLNITGTALLAIFIMFLVGILLIGQGLLAVYVARIYTETQNRPLYIVKNDT